MNLFKFWKSFFFDQFALHFGGGGGGGGPTSSTVTQSNIPDWLRPQVETLLGGATKQMFNTTPQAPIYDAEGKQTNVGQYDISGTKPFVPYSTDPSKYVAGFSPLQEQVQYNTANLRMPGQFNQATGYANIAGQGGLGTAAEAQGYGLLGYQSGARGQQLGQQAASDAMRRGDYAAGQAYNYGEVGAQAGARGQQSGLLGQQLGIEGGQYYGDMGAQYGAQGAGYGAQAAGLAPEAQMYGRTAADIGQMGLRAEDYGRNVSSQAENYARQAAGAGQNYATQVTDPNAVSQYMSPYQQNVIDVQNQAAQRNADIASTQRGAQFARAGAFGGARQAIENAEAQRALQTQLNANQATGLQNAYQQAVQNMQYGSNLGLQGLSGAQQGLGTALQGGQLGLAGLGTAMQGQQAGLQGLSTANQLYGTGIQGSQAGMQGAQVGLQGVDRQLAGTAQGMQGAQMAMQGAGVGLSGVGQAINAGQYGLQGMQAGMQGTAQGMQGAGMGLQGVSGQQAGYGLANTAASNLSNIGTQQLGAQTGILGFQNQVGAQQQSQEQQIINNAINNYAQAQQQPMQNLNAFNALLRGYAIPGQTSTQYSAAPSLTSQVVGGGTALLAGNQLLGRKSGGHIKHSDGLDALGMYNAMKGARV